MKEIKREDLGINPFGPLPNSNQLPDGIIKGDVALFTKEAASKLKYLSGNAQGLVVYILGYAKSGEDYILLDRPAIMKELGLGSNSTVVKIVKELVQQGFIQPTCKRPTYWINPNMIVIP